ncbi:ubiquitin-like protein Pup [Salinifilum ghardaiensis]
MQRDQSQKHPRSTEETAEAEPQVQGRERSDVLDDATDDVLDEIDDVLEDSPEEFVRSYVQKGGQ